MTQTNSSVAVTAGVSAPATLPKVKQPKPVKVPKAYRGIQYNACKNPACVQYGLPAPETAIKGVLGPYTVTYGGKKYPLLKCNACGETPPLKSNQGIVEEIDRLGAYLKTQEYICPNDKPDATGKVCSNHTKAVPVGTKKAYRSFGTNAAGSKRMQCCECGKTFITATKPTKGQHDTHENRTLFISMLVNKVPLSRIVRMTGVPFDRLYRRIDFIHAQCMAFTAHRERKLQTYHIKRLYLAIDAQDYMVNWKKRKDKRNIVLKAITAADNNTGYVFINALNFDEAADKNAIEADALAIKDDAKVMPLRKYARIWTESDYDKSSTKLIPKLIPAGNLKTEISNDYYLASLRDDIEAFDEKQEEEMLPTTGVQIHSEYTMIAMFHHLKNMIGNCEKWRFFLDQESGIRAAVLSVFKDKILARKAEAFYVKIEKTLTNDEKEHCVNDAETYFLEVQAAHPGKSEDEIRLMLIKDEIANLKQIGIFKDKWVSIPFPSKSEPKKEVCWLTEHASFDDDHVANLYNKASLRLVDSFFQKVRRSICMCERPMHSSANAGRIWGMYQSYDPAVLKQLLEIYRTHHNYIDLPMKAKKGKTKADLKTPAMRLGLADAVLDFTDILYFNG